MLSIRAIDSYKGGTSVAVVGNRNTVFRAITDFNKMAEEHNAKNGLFKTQFTLGNVITVLTLIATVGPMWYASIQNNAVSKQTLLELKESLDKATDTGSASKQSLAEHTAALEDIKAHIISIDKTAQQAMIDDDRLMRVQADVKEIQARIGELEKREERREIRVP